MMNTSPKGKIIVIAGATGAIGRATTARLLEEGATVLALGRDGQKLVRLADEFKASHGRHTILQIDSTAESSWKTILDLAVRRYGRVDAFVHAVGLAIPGAFLELTSREIRRIVATNFQSVVSAAHVILPSMVARGSGYFIVVGSLGGIVPMPFETLYCATKFALRGFCLSLHEEVRSSGVIVSLVAPGPVRSPMLDLEGSDLRAALTFVDRPTEPEAIAAEILHLLRGRKREIVRPALHRLPAAVVGAYPVTFGTLYPLLRKIGQRRLRKYRQSLNDSQGQDHETAGTNIQAA